MLILFTKKKFFEEKRVIFLTELRKYDIMYLERRVTPYGKSYRIRQISTNPAYKHRRNRTANGG